MVVWRGAAVLAAFGLLGAAHASAQTTILERPGVALELGGYVRSLTGVSRTGYAPPPGIDRTVGFNAEVLRLAWVLRAGDAVVVEVHQRVQSQATSSDAGFGATVAGFGVSAVPGRSVDLSTDLVRRDQVRAWHDIDRLALTLYTGAGDVTVGRQAITWGNASLFPVADLWAQFSPFELDTEEKPGVDAVRWLSYPGDRWEIDVVAADRGRRDDFSAGVRATLSLPWADVYAAGGKFWNQAIALGGISAPVGNTTLRAEAALPWDLDTDERTRVRATVGVDWVSGGLLLGGEYHYNGIGASGPDGYAEVLADPRFARGESYSLGRHYLGGLGSLSLAGDQVQVTLSSLVNVRDPSGALTPVVTATVGQRLRFSGGALIALGQAPAADAAFALRSEYGTYGSLLFGRASLYF